MCVSEVLILDDDIFGALQMQDVLEKNDFEVVGIASSCQQAKELFTEHLPNLIICRIYLNNGEVAISFVQESRSIKKVPIIYVSTHDDDETLNMAMDSSPESFLTKPFTSNQLLVSAKRVAQKYKCMRELHSLPGPTCRELEIIKHLAKGESSKKIADLLCIAYETVKSHRKNIYKKFSVSSGPETVALAYQNQWLT